MSHRIDPEEISRLRRRLLAWYDRNRRDLPWRCSADPYRIWLSEMMLQQTQVATVIPYFERFTKSFPDVKALATAKLEDVLALWAGLGYYARARNMHKAARTVVEEFGGRFPRTLDELRELPGIGAYSAAAIASIAFDVPAAVVDGNVARVIARLRGIATEVSSVKGKAVVQEIADSFAPARRCGDFNQAMMELGATVCLPGGAAKCAECPLKSHCVALAKGLVERLPRKKPKPRAKSETHVVAAVRRGGRWLTVQREKKGLWGGLWELPTAVANGTALDAAAARLVRQWSVGTFRMQPSPFCDLYRQLTHRRIRFVGFRFEQMTERAGEKLQMSGTERTTERARWLTLDQLRALGISTAMRTVITALDTAATDSRSDSGSPLRE